MLVDTPRSYKETKNDLKKQNIVLYESNDQTGTYWTLPFSTPEVNNKLIPLISFD